MEISTQTGISAMPFLYVKHIIGRVIKYEHNCTKEKPHNNFIKRIDIRIETL